MKTRSLAAVASAGVVAFGLAACGSDNSGSGSTGSSGSSSSGGSTSTPAASSGGAKLSGQIAGAGSSAQAAAQEAWVAGFQEANSGVTIAYDPVGSGGGREQFIAGGVAYAGSDAALAADEVTGAAKRCGGPDNVVEIPVYVSPIAIIYNLDGVTDLKLSSSVMAKIFNGSITKWNDPAIAGLNKGASLPSTRIAVVHRSDDSGTTDNFTDYLNKTSASDWKWPADGTWPSALKGQEAANGTSGVVSAVKNGAGTIGYADASQAGQLGQAQVQVGTAFQPPSAEAAAKILEESTQDSGTGKNVFTYTLNRTTDAASTYPVTLVSYEIACTKYDDASQASIVKGYLKYITSAAGQQAAAKNAGSAPLSDAIRTKITPAIDAIGSTSGA